MYIYIYTYIYIYIYIYIKTIGKPYNAIGKTCENDPESRLANEGRRLTQYENLTKNHRKTIRNEPQSC